MQLRLNPAMETFGDRVLRLRKERKLTQVKLAQKSGLQQSDISKIEHGTISETTKILGLARELQCDPEYLLSGKRPNPPPMPSPVHLAHQPIRPYTEPAYNEYTQAAINIFESLQAHQREGALAALRTHVGHLGLVQNLASA